jgi:DNA-binding Lrp family transcriptional regulator
MNNFNQFKTLQEANEKFSKQEYEKALFDYALVLKADPNNKEAYNGAILAEMAMSGEETAAALFDYYAVLRKEDKEDADEIMNDIIESMDGTMETLNELLAEPINDKLESEDGILYSDFKLLVKDSGDFKTTFENIMFSTRVIITAKSDFIDFLDHLLHNGFQEMGLSYLESALKIYPSDEKLRKILEDIS